LWSISPVERKKYLRQSLFPEKLFYDGENFSYKKIGGNYTSLHEHEIPSLRIASNKISAFCQLVKELYPYHEKEYVPDKNLLKELYQEIGLIETQ